MFRLEMFDLYPNTAAKCLHLFIIYTHIPEAISQRIVLHNNYMFRNSTDEKMISYLILLSPYVPPPAAAIHARTPDMGDSLF